MSDEYFPREFLSCMLKSQTLSSNTPKTLYSLFGLPRNMFGFYFAQLKLSENPKEYCEACRHGIKIGGATVSIGQTPQSFQSLDPNQRVLME